jgi:hypothetical protein
MPSSRSAAASRRIPASNPRVARAIAPIPSFVPGCYCAAHPS